MRTQPTDAAQTLAICTETKEARQEHAGDLGALGNTAVEQQAKRSGARALSEVAAGCVE